MKTYKRKALAAALMAAAAMMLASCASTSTSASETSTASSATSSAEVAKATAAIKEYLTPPTTLTGDFAGGDPVTVKSGLTVGFLSIGLASDEQTPAVDTIKKLTSELGWKLLIADGQLSQQGWATGMQYLVNQHPDAIITSVIPDVAIPSALKAAHDAGIFVVCSMCTNQVSSPVASPSDANSGVDAVAAGGAAANWITANSGAKARVAMLTYSPSKTTYGRDQGALAAFKDCSSCKVLNQTEIGASTDLAGSGAKATQSVLSRFPKGQLDYILSPSDTFNAGVFQAIRAAGRQGDVKVVSYDCDNTGLTEIRKADGVEVMCVTTPEDGNMYAAVNVIAHHEAGVKTTGEKVPFQIVTKSNVPPAGKLPTGFDFDPYFKALWKQQ